MESTLMNTAKAYMQVFTNLDPKSIVSIQTEDYRHIFAPQSMNLPGPYNRDQFLAHLEALHSMVRSSPMRIKETWPNPYLRQVLIWAEAEAEFHDFIKESAAEEGDPAVDWYFRGEYMWLLTMDETGGKVREVLEFVDSKAGDGMRSLMNIATRQIKKRQG